MKCKNCGLSRDAHTEIAGPGGRKVWQCPNGSGDTYPVASETTVELHYRPDGESPWVARWDHPTAGPGEAISRTPAAALELAGREIEKALEEKTGDEGAIEEAIKET
jgi:hypothetical protein